MMEKILLSLVFLFGISATFAQTCPGELGWMKYEENCYKFNSFPRVSKTDATQICKDDGAELVSIKTLTEHQFIDRWLQSNVEDRDQKWLTSGVVQTTGVKWDSDGSVSTTFSVWMYPDGNRFPNSLVVLEYTGTEYKWNVGMTSAEYPFICEISINEVYRITQEFRDFDYGLDLDNPSLAPRGPKFIQEPDNTVLLSIPAAFHMDCVASALPEARYEWLKEDLNGNMMPMSANDRYTFTTGRLTINSPRTEDGGTYQCMAINEYGQILSRSASVTFGELGEFSNLATAPVTGKEFQGAQLECPTIIGNPAISYQWYKGFNNFIRPNFQKHTFISANGKLYFSTLYPSDQDEYTCMASLVSQGNPGNYLGAFQAPTRNSLPFDLIVQSEVAFTQAPIIQNEFIYIYPNTPMRGGDVRLECFAYGNGKLMYSWSRKGKPLPKGAMLASNDRVLTLFDVGLEVDGEYECRVFGVQSGQADVKSTQLIIQAKPFFTYELTNQHVDIGSQLTWTCEAGGRPEPVYTWYKNGEVLTSFPGVTVTNNHLVIDALDPQRDNGMYQCGARNRYGTTFSSAQLRVLQLAPSFTKSPMLKSIVSALGGNVTILCNPTAAPSPRYTWSKDNRDLGLTMGQFLEDDRLKVLLNGNLLITYVQASDQGTYKCIAENGIGSAEDFSVLTTTESTVISLPPADDHVDVNRSITIICEATHPPNTDMVYSWMFNDHIINYDREPEFRVGSREGTFSKEGYLYILRAGFKNEGYYTCLASTSMGTVSARAYITVYGPPGEPVGLSVDSNPVSMDDDPNNPDNMVNRDTTRWLMWSDGEDHDDPISTYTIEFNTNFDRSWRVHPDADLIPKSATINTNFPKKRYFRLTNLKAGAMVSFRVRAGNAYGMGVPSLPTTDTKIADAAPTVPVQNIRSGGGSVGDLSILWDPLPREDFNAPDISYIVEFREYDGSSVSDQSSWTTKEISHKDACNFVPEFSSGLIEVCKFVELVGADMFYQLFEVYVTPKNAKGEGPKSDLTVIRSAEELPLAAPTNVKALQYNATALMVVWVPIPNDRRNARGELKGYKINYWRMNQDKETDALQNIIELPKGYTNLDRGLIIGLEAFQWYSFNVQAYNTAGNGPKSSDYDQQTFNKAPNQYPTEVHVFSIDGFGVRVNFRGISTQWREEPLIGYKVQFWKARENILSAGEANFGKLTTGVIRNLTSSELYQLRVYGYSRGGQGKRSSPSIFFTVGDGEILINQQTMELTNMATSPSAPISHLLIVAILTCLLNALNQSRS